MPKTVEELEKMFNETSLHVKDIELKLESANRDAKHFQELATTRETELQKFKEQVSKSEQDRTAALAKARESEISEFIESKVKAGVIKPAIKDKVFNLMKGLDGEKIVATFKEKDGSERSHNQLSLFKEIISAMAQSVPVEKEFSYAETNATVDPSEVEGEEHFAEIKTGGVTMRVPTKGDDLDKRAKEYQESQRKIGISVSYEDALIAVSPKRSKK